MNFNRTIVFYLALISVIIICGCGPEKTKLGPPELEWINVYNEGDTLIFRSQNGMFDSSFIIKKEIYYPDYDYKNERKYLPQWGVLWYRNKHLINHPDGYRLITIEKKTPQDNTYFQLNFLYSSAVFFNKELNSFKQTIKGDIYEFNTYIPNSPEWKPKRIYWHKKYGIIKYITHDNIAWERINIKDSI
jgi:hypothetical protein